MAKNNVEGHVLESQSVGVHPGLLSARGWLEACGREKSTPTVWHNSLKGWEKNPFPQPTSRILCPGMNLNGFLDFINLGKGVVPHHRMAGRAAFRQGFSFPVILLKQALAQGGTGFLEIKKIGAQDKTAREKPIQRVTKKSVASPASR